MKQFCRFAGCVMLAAALASPQAAPEPSMPKADIKAAAEEVVLDVVVRDRKGKEVRDLAPGDIEVTDNGITREIRSLRLVEGREAIEKGAKVALDPLRQIRLVTLLFERLDVEQRRLARTAAEDLIKDQAQNVYYAVVVNTNQLNVIQDFTADREKLKKAIGVATEGKYQALPGVSAQLRQQLEQVVGGNTGRMGLQEAASARAAQGVQAPAAGPSNPNAMPDTSGVLESRAASVLLRMYELSTTVTEDEASRGSINTLLAVARGNALLPGRKTVIYFNVGLYVPPFLQENFEAVISAANRANVSFYPVDARGLLADRQNQSSADVLSGAIADSQKTVANKGYEAVGLGEVRSSENAERAMRSNTMISPELLAKSTGGFTIANTNDFRAPLKRVSEEINTYYELTYNPRIENYDASFRRIAVKVNRPEIQVQARSGYFALPPSPDGSSTTILPYEMALLKALDTKPLAHDVDFRAAALHYQPAPEGTRTAVVMELPLKNLQFTTDEATKSFKGRVSMVALLKDANGTVVRKFNRDLPIQSTMDKLEGIKAGNFTYMEQVTLPPGRYTLESALIDRESNKIGAKRAAVTVPAKSGGVSMSSIALVRKWEQQAPQTLGGDDSFVYQAGKITPTLNNTIKAAKGSQLSMYFVVYPDKAVAAKPELTVEYIKDGQVIGAGQLPLPDADAHGRIPHVMSSSAEAMPPGTYEIRAVVKQGGSAAEERAFITVE